jgi:hypothetical protein
MIPSRVSVENGASSAHKYGAFLVCLRVAYRLCTKKGCLMSFASLQSRALLGFQAQRVRVEVHLANGLPSFTLVGLVDTEVREARERVRCAIQNSGLNFPANKRITVNLAPADLPKDSGRFDLPIALGISAYEFAGELSLAGDLRPIRGGLAMSLARHAETTQLNWVLPAESAEEAALVPTAKIYKALHLRDVVHHFLNPASAAEPTPGWSRLAPPECQPQAPDSLDLADVKGCGRSQRAADRVSGHGEIHAGGAFRGPAAPHDARGRAGVCGGGQPGRSRNPVPMVATPHSQPTPLGNRCGLDRRRLTAAPWGNFLGTPWRAVPG